PGEPLRGAGPPAREHIVDADRVALGPEWLPSRDRGGTRAAPHQARRAARLRWHGSGGGERSAQPAAEPSSCGRTAGAPHQTRAPRTENAPSDEADSGVEGAAVGGEETERRAKARPAPRNRLRARPPGCGPRSVAAQRFERVGSGCAPGGNGARNA